MYPERQVVQSPTPSTGSSGFMRVSGSKDPSPSSIMGNADDQSRQGHAKYGCPVWVGGCMCVSPRRLPQIIRGTYNRMISGRFAPSFHL